MLIFKLFFWLIATFAIAASIFLFIPDIFQKLLEWNNVRGVFGSGIGYIGFETSAASIEGFYVISNFLFIGFVVFIILFLLALLLPETNNSAK